MSEITYHGPVVAFDLDDTLFRERDYCRSGFRFLCDPDRHMVSGAQPYPPKGELDSLYVRMDRELTARRNPFIPFEEFFRPLVERNGEEWNLQAHIDTYRSHTPSLTLDENVSETLESLATRGIRMALITDGRSLTQRRKIEALGLEKYFAPEMILISGETGHEKTDSKEMFARVVRHYPEAKSFQYVGNNPRKDFYFPNLMGWTTFQVPPHPDDVHPDIEPPTPLHAASVKLKNFDYLCSLFR